MATEVKNAGFAKEERNLVLRALLALSASTARAKQKEIKDDQMVEIYDRRIAEINNLMAKITNKELF